MHLNLARFALIAAALQGCLPTQPDDWSRLEIEPQTAYVWNGEECIEAVQTQEQLSQLENLSVFVRRNGEIEMFLLYAENVSPAAIQVLWTQGGAINLPNGEKLTFPPGTSSSQSEFISAVRAKVERTRTLSYHDVEFSGPLPEITTAK